MNSFQVNYKNLIPDIMKTNPQNVSQANEGLFYATMNLPDAAAHCGMTQKEMKMTFREFLKYHPMTYKG